MLVFNSGNTAMSFSTVLHISSIHMGLNSVYILRPSFLCIRQPFPACHGIAGFAIDLLTASSEAFTTYSGLHPETK